jgi:hypothetical protein
MTTLDGDEVAALNIREKLAHIDLMLAQHDRERMQTSRLSQEITLAPWVAAIGLVTAGAALFAAAFAFAKLFH